MLPSEVQISTKSSHKEMAYRMPELETNHILNQAKWFQGQYYHENSWLEFTLIPMGFR